MYLLRPLTIFGGAKVFPRVPVLFVQITLYVGPVLGVLARRKVIMTLNQWCATDVLLSMMGGTNETTESTVRVADVSGRKLLVSVQQQLPIGSAVKLSLNGNVILGEVHGTHFLSGAKHYVIFVDHIIPVTRRQVQPPLDVEAAQPRVDAPDPLAVLLRGIRESALLNSPAAPAFQSQVRQLEESLGKQPSSIVAARAVQLLAQFRNDTVNDMQGRFRLVNGTLHMMSLMLAEAAAEDERLANVRAQLGGIQNTLTACFAEA